MSISVSMQPALLKRISTQTIVRFVNAGMPVVTMLKFHSVFIVTNTHALKAVATPKNRLTVIIAFYMINTPRATPW